MKTVIQTFVTVDIEYIYMKCSMIEYERKHCQVIRNGANSLFQTTLRKQNQFLREKKKRVFKSLAVVMEKS